MAAYCVGTIRVKKAGAWAEYRSRVGATIAAHGGTVLFRGSRENVLAGSGEHDFVVAIRFESIDAANRWHDSPDYQALVPNRDRAADVSLVLYQD